MSRFAQPGWRVNSCCFPDCEKIVSDQVALPLCTGHCLVVYNRVTTKLAPREIQTWLAGRGQFKLPPLPDPSTLGYVYFVRLGNRVKIGYSRNPAERFKEVPLEEVLTITPGSQDDERAAHIRFAHLRTTGEWFKAEPELLKYAKSLPSSIPK